MTSPVWGLTPLLVFGPALTCVTPRVAALLYVLSSLAFLIMDWRQNRPRLQPDRSLALLLGSFIVYGLISVLWSIAPSDTPGKAGQLMLAFVPLMFMVPAVSRLTQADLELLGKLLLSGLGLGLLVYTSEIFSGFALYGALRDGPAADQDIMQNKPAALFVLWFLMSLPWLGRKSVRHAVIAVVAAFWTGYAVYESESSSVMIIFMVAPIVALASATLKPRWALNIAFAVMIGLTALSPVLARHIYTDTPWATSKMPNSLKSRVEIWDQAARRSFERPVFGWGLDSSPELPNRNEISLLYPGEEMPITHLHPHNAPLQIWFELGAVGITFVLGLMMLLYRRIGQLGDMAQRYAIFMVSIVFLYTLTIWGIWQSWFIATLCFTGLMTYAGARRLMRFEDRA